jgi:hypothetical protein
MKLSWTRSLSAISAGLLMLAVFNASAADALPTLRVVTNTNDSGAGSLRQAILDADASNTDDTIVFQSGLTGTITLTSGDLEIVNSLTINGPGASTLAISGGGNFQVFIIENLVGSVSISGLTIEGGFIKFSGGGIENLGTLTLTDCTVSGNSATLGGGGIENFNGGTLTLVNSTVSDNSSTGGSGFGSGAGILNEGTSTVTNSTVSDNSATNIGGGILNAGTLTLTSTTVSGNSSQSQGGGIHNGGTLTLINSTVSGNSAAAVHALVGFGGGGIENSGTLSVTNSTVSDNSTATAGGGIDNLGMLTLTNSTLSGNSANSQNGGGIENFANKLTVTNSTISDNSTTASGGGIDNGSSAMLTLTNSTLSGNSANDGGGIENEEFGILTLVNSTLSGNSANSVGGIENETNGSVTLKNTLLASGPSGANCLSNGTFSSDGHNLSDDKTCNSFFNATGDLNNTSAGLDPGGLKDNGGLTQTIALLAISAAVDAVPVSPTNYCTATDGTTPIATDQRGMARPQGTACDIGAFELAPLTVAGKLKISPNKLNFGTVTVDQPKIKMVRVTNAGKIKKKSHPLPILIEMETESGMPSPSAFSVTSQCSDDDLQPGGKGVPKSETFCEVAVQFEPTQAVSYTGTLTILDNLEPSEKQTVQMTGKGKASK